MILVDTPIWFLALRRRHTGLDAAEQRHVREWERLVRAGTVTLIGPIRQELLSGLRNDALWERLRVALRPFPDLPIGTADYETAAAFFNRCRARGVTESVIDLLICAVADRLGALVYTFSTRSTRRTLSFPRNLLLASSGPTSLWCMSVRTGV